VASPLASINHLNYHNQRHNVSIIAAEIPLQPACIKKLSAAKQGAKSNQDGASHKKQSKVNQATRLAPVP